MNRRQNQLLILGTKIEVIVFFGVALSLYIVLFKSTLSNAKMQRNWLDSALNCWEWIQGRSLSVRCNHVEELSKHIPTLFPKEGHLLQTQLRT